MSSAKQEADRMRIQAKLNLLAEEISADLSRLEGAQSKELLSDFVSRLFLSAAKRDQREFRRQRQTEGIAEAKARGVRFGPARKPLPENFEECYTAWRRGQITQTQAADICGISRQTFSRAVSRMEQAGRQAV